MSRDPFHDFLREKISDNGQASLLSEGGSSLARTPEPLCIDSIQVSHTCTTESRHIAYRCTAGACTLFSSPDNSLFSVPCGVAAELDSVSIPAVLRARFEQRGVPLSEGARLEVQQAGRTWLITDKDSRYSVRRSAARLTVYPDP